MKSRTSFFNKGLSKNLFRRFWPLWAGYLLLLIFVLPVNIYNSLETKAYYYGNPYISLPENAVLFSAGTMMVISFFAGAAAAMAVFGDLYRSRTCSMLGSLPVKRESIFITAYISGLAPMLIGDIIIFLITLIMDMADPYALFVWLAAALTTNITFFSMACLCAVLTGNLIVLPAVYFVLNLTPLVVQDCIQGILGKIVHGYMRGAQGFWSYLSPFSADYQSFRHHWTEQGALQVEGLGVLFAYCALGLIMAAAALLIFRRRNMESCGDVVAVKCLKPVFKYCMSLGTGIVLAFLVSSLLPERSFRGTGGALLMLVLTLLGAITGFYASEMLMQKSLRVFRTPARGLAAVAAVFGIFILGYEFDVFGYEKYVPETDEIEYVRIRGLQIEEPEDIELVRELHSSLAEDKDGALYAEQLRETIMIEYGMNKGGQVCRQYTVPADREASNDPDSYVSRLYDFLSLPQNILKSQLPEFPVIPENIRSCVIYVNSYGADGVYRDDRIVMNPDEAYDFYLYCVLPDILDGNLGRSYPPYSERLLEEESNVQLSMDLAEGALKPDGSYEDMNYGGIYLNLSLKAERCMAWLEENADIGIVSYGEYAGGSEAYYGDYYYDVPAAEALP